MNARGGSFYFDKIYNPLYDWTTARFDRYVMLQRRCVAALAPENLTSILCVGLGTGNELLHIEAHGLLPTSLRSWSSWIGSSWASRWPSGTVSTLAGPSRASSSRWAKLATGMDAFIYKEEIRKYWGVLPYNSYVSTEMSFIALQSWTKKDMTFLPDLVFLEFIPYGPDTDPDEVDAVDTVLLDELKEGGLYELVITQFHGMPLMRYRMRDLIRVVSLADPETGTRLPQIAFQRKVDETINLGSLCTLDERTLWQAISEAGIRYGDWTAKKEFEGGQSFLAVHIEILDEETPLDVARKIDENLKRIDVDYRDIARYLAMNPVRVSVLPVGTFARYSAARVREGADLAHLKPKHINPSDSVFEQLMKARTADG